MYILGRDYFEMEVCHSLRIQHIQNSVLITFQTSPIFPES